MEHKQVVLIILDGWGHREYTTNNAIAQAKTPFFDSLWSTYPHTLLDASGLAVGLPQGQMGNSEIGHTTIGAGRALDTDLVRIKKSIDNDEFVSNPAFTSLFKHVKKFDSTLHIKGLLSDGGVHSHQEHLFAFLKAAKKAGIHKIAIHIYTDGRDTAPQSAAAYIKELEQVLRVVGIGFIASASGRFYAMDRDNNWDRISKVENVLFNAKSLSEKHTIKTNTPSETFEKLYELGIVDEHVEPIVFLDDNNKSYKIEKNDGVLFFNFRSDRARMISKKIAEQVTTMNLCFVTMTEYQKELKAMVAFPAIEAETTLAAEISEANLTQAHIAETEKFPHATYFLNGGREIPHKGEVHELLESRKDVQTHDKAPEMRAEAIADKAIEHINKGTNFIFINFANPDMVGHTGNVPAIIEAVEEVDKQLERVVTALVEKKGIAIVTADHGNAEVNVDLETKTIHTAHTTNLVPCIITDPNIAKLVDNQSLTSLAPTTLAYLGIEKPKGMTGINLAVE